MKRISFDEVRRNNIKTVVLFAVFFGLVLGIALIVGASLGNTYSGVFIALAVFLVYGLIAWFQGKNISLRMTGAQKAPEQRFNQLHNVVEEVSIAAGIPKPEVYIIHDSMMNAFATGTKPENAAVAITTGLLERLNRDELTGVMAHEVAHIKHNDTRTMLIAGVLVGSVILLADIAFRTALFGGGDRRDGRLQIILIVVGVVAMIVAPIAAELIKLAISRKREFAADAEAVTITRNPSGLIGALEKLSNQPRKQMKNSSRALNHMYITPTEEDGWFQNLFRTHPPTEERIKNLTQM